jgi:hypothetical protein
MTDWKGSERIMLERERLLAIIRYDPFRFLESPHTAPRECFPAREHRVGRSPGEWMIRSHLCLIMLFGSSTARTPLLAQEGSLAVGDTVRVRNAVPLLTTGASTGILVHIASDTLVLRSLRDSETSWWLLQGRSSVAVKRGQKSFGVLKGMLIGAAISVAGTLIYEGSDSFAKRGCELIGYSQSGNPIYGNCDRERREGGTLIIPLGAVVGGVTGHMIKRDRWVDIRRHARAP